MLDSFLDANGFVVFTDYGKLVNQGGIDRVAYDPKTDHVYLFDNAAQKKTINLKSALSVERLGVENLDGVRDVLDRYTGFTNEARAAWNAGRVEFVVANAHPGGTGGSFSRQVFERGWIALDFATGGFYRDVQSLWTARAQLSGQKGFASVGGLAFTVVSVGGLVLALSEIDSSEELQDFAAGAVVSGAASWVGARMLRSPVGGGVIGIVVGLKDDQGGDSEEEEQREREEEAVDRFLEHYFPDDAIAEGGAALREQAWDLLFGTDPWVLIAEPSLDGTPVSRLAMSVIGQLDASDRWWDPTDGTDFKVIQSALINVMRAGESVRFYEILRSKLGPEGADYFARLMSYAEADPATKQLLEYVIKEVRKSDPPGQSPTEAGRTPIASGDGEDRTPIASGGSNDRTPIATGGSEPARRVPIAAGGGEGPVEVDDGWFNMEEDAAPKALDDSNPPSPLLDADDNQGGDLQEASFTEGEAGASDQASSMAYLDDGDGAGGDGSETGDGDGGGETDVEQSEETAEASQVVLSSSGGTTSEAVEDEEDSAESEDLSYLSEGDTSSERDADEAEDGESEEMPYLDGKDPGKRSEGMSYLDEGPAGDEGNNAPADDGQQEGPESQETYYDGGGDGAVVLDRPG